MSLLFVEKAVPNAGEGSTNAARQKAERRITRKIQVNGMSIPIRSDDAMASIVLCSLRAAIGGVNRNRAAVSANADPRGCVRIDPQNSRNMDWNRKTADNASGRHR